MDDRSKRSVSGDSRGKDHRLRVREDFLLYRLTGSDARTRQIATGRELRPPQMDKFRDAFEPAGLREIAAENATAALLQRFGADSDVQKAAAELDQAHKIEERFVKDFEGQGFAARWMGTFLA
jgi:hypothetical protein